MVMANEYVQKLKLEIANLEERRTPDGRSVRPELASHEGTRDEHWQQRSSGCTVEIDGVVNAARTDYLAAKAKEDSLVGALERAEGRGDGSRSQGGRVRGARARSQRPTASSTRT